MDLTPSSEKSKFGKSYPASFKKGIEKPPNAASTWR